MSDGSTYNCVGSTAESCDTSSYTDGDQYKRFFRSGKGCGEGCGPAWDAEHQNDCEYGEIVHYNRASKDMSYCAPFNDGQEREHVLADLTCDSSKAANDPDRWSIAIQTAHGYFSEDSANNPDAAGTCDAPPHWTFDLEGSNVRAGCCKEGNTHGACCRSYGLDFYNDGSEEYVVDTFGNEMLDESDSSYGEPFFKGYRKFTCDYVPKAVCDDYCTAGVTACGYHTHFTGGQKCEQTDCGGTCCHCNQSPLTVLGDCGASYKYHIGGNIGSGFDGTGTGMHRTEATCKQAAGGFDHDCKYVSFHPSKGVNMGESAIDLTLCTDQNDKNEYGAIMDMCPCWPGCDCPDYGGGDDDDDTGEGPDPGGDDDSDADTGDAPDPGGGGSDDDADTGDAPGAGGGGGSGY